MNISLFDLFSIGIGPSSSHTVGPMKAAHAFTTTLADCLLLDQTTRVQIELFGSLAFTGKGHGTDNALLLGLENNTPDRIKPETIRPRAKVIIEKGTLDLHGSHTITFNYTRDLIFNDDRGGR